MIRQDLVVTEAALTQERQEAPDQVVVSAAAEGVELGPHADVGRDEQPVAIAGPDDLGDVVGPAGVGLIVDEADVVDLEVRAGLEDRHLSGEVAVVALVADDDPFRGDAFGEQQVHLVEREIAVVGGVGRDRRVGRDARERSGPGRHAPGAR